MGFGPNQKQQPQSPGSVDDETPSAPKTKTICVMSRAAFGHHLNGWSLPRNKAVLIDIEAKDFDNEGMRPTPESWMGRALAIHPGLLEYIDETDDRCVGKHATAETKAILQAQPAKRVETIKVCGYSRQPRGHYRARVFWPSDPQSPIVYEVPKAALRELEADKQIAILSPTKPDQRTGERKFFEPPGAISGADYFAELQRKQKQDAEDDEVFDRVKRRKQEEESRRQRVVRATAS